MDYSSGILSGDGDGVRNNARYQIPSSRKFTATTKRTNTNMKIRLERALKEIKKPNTKLQSKNKRVECASINTPITRRKRARNSEELNVSIYATPRGTISSKLSTNEASDKIFKCILLHAWRKTRHSHEEISKLVLEKDEKITKMNMQIDVLQNLRKSESTRREEITMKYQDVLRQFDVISNENSFLKQEKETLDKNYNETRIKLMEMKEQLNNYKNSCQEKQEALKNLNEKLEKEKEILRKFIADKKTLSDQNAKLENMLDTQNEKIGKLKVCFDNMKNSKQSLAKAIEESERLSQNRLEELHAQSLLIESYKNKIFEYAKEKDELTRALNRLQIQFDEVSNEYIALREKNERIHHNILDLSQRLEDESNKCPWNLMKKGMFSTFCTLKYLANLILPALQSNLRC